MCWCVPYIIVSDHLRTFSSNSEYTWPIYWVFICVRQVDFRAFITDPSTGVHVTSHYAKPSGDNWGQITNLYHYQREIKFLYHNHFSFHLKLNSADSEFFPCFFFINIFYFTITCSIYLFPFHHFSFPSIYLTSKRKLS